MNILLTGRPGIGKTSVIMKLAGLVTAQEIAGFYTEEIREAGQRVGFHVHTFSGAIGVLSHVNIRSKHRVGRYGVDVPAFEQLILPELARPCGLFLIDEIGKMECFSVEFQNAVKRTLDSTMPVVATVAQSGGGFIAEVKARSDVDVWSVTQANRDTLPQQLAQRIANKT